MLGNKKFSWGGSVHIVSSYSFG